MPNNPVSFPNRFSRWIFVILVLMLIGTTSLTNFFRFEQSQPYIEPILLTQSEEQLSVIISTNDVDKAMRAVEQIDGTITSNLWIINSIGATIPASSLHQLSRTPGIMHIVENKSVSVEGGYDCSNGPTETGPCSSQNGYATNQHRLLGNHSSGSSQLSPTVNLQDGGNLSVAEDGTILIVNSDGTLRANFTLPTGQPFNYQPTVGSDGTIAVTGEGNQVYGIQPHGAIRWVFTNNNKFKASVAISPDNTIYALDNKLNLFALNPATGDVIWHYHIVEGDDEDRTLSSPVVAPNGTIYVVTKEGLLTAISSSGSYLWSYEAGDDDEIFNIAPILAPDETIYLTNKKSSIIAVNSDGTHKYSQTVIGNIVTPPTLGDDGTLYVSTKSSRIYAINPNGAVRFVFNPGSGNFETSVALSPDGAQLYAALKEQKLFAIDISSGAELWRYDSEGELHSNPIVNSYGNIYLGEQNGRITILDSDGNLLYSNNQFGNISQNLTLSDDESIIFFPTDDKDVFTLSLMPNSWDNSPDVLSTSDPMVYDFLYPHTIDVGADQLHDDYIQNGNPITGNGVGIAIIDSGIYFTDDVKDILGTDVKDLFLGQANFVEDGLCGTEGGSQNSGYCFTDEKNSLDSFGHGTHIAGTIWNHFTDYSTGVHMGVAPGAEILSVRVLDESGKGTYEDVIEGIQYVVANKNTFNIKVINLSLSGNVSSPYFVDPLNRAVEQAWADGIVVVAAAGNSGPGAETIMVPGNDPYIITVGALDSNRTPGYWLDDSIPYWSANGPTLDGFIKPDVVAPGGNIISYIYNDSTDINNSAELVQEHPDYSLETNLFRMNGTSMAAGITSGVIALILEANPSMTPDQIKFRLMASSKFATSNTDLAYNAFQQGAGRIWAPDAVFGQYPLENGNQGMDILDDLAHPWEANDDPDPENNPDLEHHYQGLIQKIQSDDGTISLYFFNDPDETDIIALGAAQSDDNTWIGREVIENLDPLFSDGAMSWNNGYAWAGGYGWLGGSGYGWLGGSGYGWLGGSGYGWLGGSGYGWLGGSGYGWLGGSGYGWLGGSGYGWLGGSNFDWTEEDNDEWVPGIELESTDIPVPIWIDDYQPTPTALPMPTATPTSVPINLTAPTYRLFVPIIVNSQ